MRRLVLAVVVQHGQDHQVRLRKQPLFRLPIRRLRRARDKADVPGAREMTETFEANACQDGSLRVCKIFWLALTLIMALSSSLIEGAAI
jgi:hypothetical protein